ncbi:MAG: PEGA domain-containing protein, partial [Deltaproteobacteria bacterium]
RADESARAPHRTPTAAPVDTAADTGSTPRQQTPRVPRWAWILSGVGLVAIGFVAVFIATTLAQDTPPEGDRVAHRDTPGASTAHADPVPTAAPDTAPVATSAPQNGGDAVPTAVTTPNVPEEEPDVRVAEADTSPAPPSDAQVAVGEPPDGQAPPPEAAVAQDDSAAVALAAQPVKTTRRAVGEGTVAISARPYANVLIDGKPAGTTPLASQPLRAGRHKLTLVHPTYGTKTRVVTIKAHELTHVLVNMEE